jgi:hypothetical protein
VELCRFRIIDCGEYMTIANADGSRKHHCHVGKMGTAQMLVRLMKRKEVPDSPYLREAVKRVTLDQQYIERIDSEIAKSMGKNLGGRGTCE